MEKLFKEINQSSGKEREDKEEEDGFTEGTKNRELGLLDDIFMSFPIKSGDT